MNVAAAALAILMGLALGLLGGGGSILTVPILVYVVGFEAKRAIAMSLGVVGVTSLAGALRHRRAGNVVVRTALLFGVVTMAAAYAAARLAVYIDGRVQLIMFGVIMLLAAAFMFRQGPPAEGARVPSRPLLIAAGLAVGAVTGLVGVGGGFLIVPALVLLAHLPMKQAVGTSLLVIALNSMAGMAGYVGQVDFAWGFMAAFTAFALAGIVAGAHLVQFVSQEALKRGFAVFLVIMGFFILYQNWQ
jgi:uncharacterized membrane protein YfcA